MKKIKKLFVGILALVCALSLCACFDPAPNPDPKPNPGEIVTPEPDPKPEPKQTFTVSFETNGASAEEAKKAEEGSAVELPALEKDGSVFVGWYETAALEGAPLNGSYTPSKDITLHAKWATPTSDEYFEYELDAASDTYRITEVKDGHRSDTTPLVIPLMHGGKIVSGIANGGMDGFDSAESITIGSNITYMEYGAFSHLYETENMYVDPSNPVFFSEGNAVITKKKFMSKLMGDEVEIPEYTLMAGTKDVEISSSVKSIGAVAFGCSHNLTQIEIPSTVKTIGMGAFLETYLVEVIFPEGVEQIDSNVFMYCGKIEKIVLPVSLKVLAPDALVGISSTAVYTVTYNGTRAQWNKLTENWTADEKAEVSVRCSDDPAMPEDRTLTNEQIHTAYKNVGHIVNASLYADAALSSRRAAPSAKASDSHKYEVRILDVFGKYMKDAPSDFDIHEWFEMDEELQIYFRIAEYCTAFDEFTVGDWHRSDTSEGAHEDGYYYEEMYVRLWYDNDYIYSCYAIRELDLISYSVVDYDYSTGDFYCLIYIGQMQNVLTSDGSDVELHRAYEIAYESGKLSGFFNGIIYDGLTNKVFDEETNNQNIADKVYEEGFSETLLTSYFKDICFDTATYAKIKQGIDAPKNDDFAWNFFVALEALSSNTEYTRQAAELKDALAACPDGLYKDYLTSKETEILAALDVILQNCGIVDNWVYYNAQAMLEKLREEVLLVPKVTLKIYDEFNKEWRETEYSYYYLYSVSDGVMTPSFDEKNKYYTDEACTVELTAQTLATLPIDGTAVLYQKF